RNHRILQHARQQPAQRRWSARGPSFSSQRFRLRQLDLRLQCLTKLLDAVVFIAGAGQVRIFDEAEMAPMTETRRKSLQAHLGRHASVLPSRNRRKREPIAPRDVTELVYGDRLTVLVHVERAQSRKLEPAVAVGGDFMNAQEFVVLKPRKAGHLR